MNNISQEKYEQTMARFMAAKQKKQEAISRLEQTMKEEYDRETL